MTTVQVALTQTPWTGDQASMLDLHETYAREAAAAGADIVGFQELFTGPYFGITQDPHYYSYVETIPGPTVNRFADLAKELGVVMVLPVYEEEHAGIYYNTSVLVDSDGTLLGKYRKHHIPHVEKFWEKFYFRPGNLGYPVFETAVGRIGMYICYDRHFPEGWRALGLAGADIVFNPNATKPGLSNRLWEIEQPSAAAANGYFVAAANRVGSEANEYGEEAVSFYGSSYLVGPDGNFVGDIASGTEAGWILREADLSKVRTQRETWQFYRDRRPDSYGPISAP